MTVSRLVAACLLALSLASLNAPASNAQGWVTLPNGEAGYTTDLTTTGFFQCGDPFYMIGTCQASGNSIALGSGGSIMLLTFHGLSQVITAMNVGKSVPLGTVTKKFDGSGDFLFPTSKNINVSLFFLYIVLSTRDPVVDSEIWGAGYLPLSRTRIPKSCCDHLWDVALFPRDPAPAPYMYGAFVLDGFAGGTMTVSGEPANIHANVAIVPEPATIWLTGSGLVGVFAAVRRCRPYLPRRAERAA